MHWIISIINNYTKIIKKFEDIKNNIKNNLNVLCLCKNLKISSQPKENIIFNI